MVFNIDSIYIFARHVLCKIGTGMCVYDFLVYDFHEATIKELSIFPSTVKSQFVSELKSRYKTDTEEQSGDLKTFTAGAEAGE